MGTILHLSTIAKIMHKNPQQSDIDTLTIIINVLSIQYKATHITPDTRSSKQENRPTPEFRSRKSLFQLPPNEIVVRPPVKVISFLENLPSLITISHPTHSSPKPPSDHNVPLRTFRSFPRSSQTAQYRQPFAHLSSPANLSLTPRPKRGRAKLHYSTSATLNQTCN